jgi:acyl carrier protein
MPATNLEFVRRLAEALNEDESSVAVGTLLTDLQGWDSVGQLSAIALIDEYFNRRVSVDALRKCQSVGDLLELATT